MNPPMATMLVEQAAAWILPIAPTGSVTAAWRPFIDPINAHRVWYLLLIPMAWLISMVYKAVRLPDLEKYWRQVTVMSAQIVLWIIALGAGLYVFIQHLAPLITTAR
ncbi:MAG: hypothetical protein KF787_04850 [Phycisphaeraceae bacterium]|nr:hypothetical protein [Phycisphaeraceae bacterium]